MLLTCPPVTTTSKPNRSAGTSVNSPGVYIAIALLTRVPFTTAMFWAGCAPMATVEAPGTGARVSGGYVGAGTTSATDRCDITIFCPTVTLLFIHMRAVP